MNRLWVFLIVVIGAMFAVTPAFAWDVTINGDYMWAYDYFDQYGHAGFFGAYDQASAR